MAKLVKTVAVSDDGEIVLPPEVLNALGIDDAVTLIFNVVDGVAKITVDRSAPVANTAE